MLKIFNILIGLLLATRIIYAGELINSEGRFDMVPSVQEEDGTPDVYAPTVIKFSNGTVTDNGDGSVTIDYNADNIDITDVGAYYTGTEVETALQEIGVGTIGAVYFLKLDGSNANQNINIGSYDFTTTGNLIGDTITTMSVPASSAATGTTGSIAEDADYIYICIATDTWKRIPLSAWGAPGDKILMSDGTSNILMSDGTSVILMSN